MLTFYGKIEVGILKIISPVKVANDIKMCEDGLVEITLKHKNQRSLKQNGYYWYIPVNMIRQRLLELGNQLTTEEVHDFLKEKFNGKMIIGPGGELLGETGQSTQSMSKEEFGVYLEQIIHWAADFLEIVIPLPGEQTEMEL